MLDHMKPVLQLEAMIAVQGLGYVLEFTSSQFSRNAENILVVNEANIDRDPPSQNVLIVQVQ
jgi:hypothetical protein